jgi:integrase/recombinase XerD
MYSIADTSSYGYKQAVRNIVVIELFFATGGRVSEIATIRSGHINLQNGSVLLQGKDSRERLVQVCNSETLSLLRLYQRLCHAEIAQ